jgi:hypothetical protein
MLKIDEWVGVRVWTGVREVGYQVWINFLYEITQ